MLPQANEQTNSQARVATTVRDTILCNATLCATTQTFIRAFQMAAVVKSMPLQQIEITVSNMLPHWPWMFICAPVINKTWLHLLQTHAVTHWRLRCCYLTSLYVYTNTTLLWLAWTPLASKQLIMLHFYCSDAQLPWNADEAFNQSRVTACSHK